MNNRFTIF